MEHILSLGLFFWMVAISAWVTTSLFFERKLYALGGAAIGIYSVILYLISDYSLVEIWDYFSSISFNQYVTFFSIYVSVGMVYSLIRWICMILYVKKKLLGYIVHNKIERLQEEHLTKFFSIIGMNGSQHIPLKVSDNRHLLIHWMAFWPVTIPISIKPIKIIFGNLLNSISGIMQSISNKLFGSFIPKE